MMKLFPDSSLACIAVVAVQVAMAVTCNAEDQKLTAEHAEFFESKIRPILVEHCYQCHSSDAEEIEGGLVLDSKWGWETGGDSGPAIIPGNLDESFLIDAVRYEEKSSARCLRSQSCRPIKFSCSSAWVEMGVPDPRAKVEKGNASAPDAFDLQTRWDEHWVGARSPIQRRRLCLTKIGRWETSIVSSCIASPPPVSIPLRRRTNRRGCAAFILT